VSKVYFTSDLHLGHRNIHKLRSRVETSFQSGEFIEFSEEKEHVEALVDLWSSVVTKRDTVFVLGDVAFTKAGLDTFSQLPGRKRVILGNHDIDGKAFAPIVDSVEGLVKYKKQFWLSHSPIHPEELRGKLNIHGHVHYQTLDDSRYFSVCPENIGLAPIPYETILRIINDRNS
jgi:calcineurin-like phosphoesterase family protein